MKQQVLTVLALSGLILLPMLVKGQDKAASDKAWPALGSEKIINEGRPRFMVESQKLERAGNVSNPLAVTRCLPSSDPCIVWMGVADFFSEWKGSVKESNLRPDVIMHHYPHALLDGHYRGTGTYVFYLPKQKVFYLWGDCAMGHADELAGPFAGDPRLVLKKLVKDPDSVTQLGFLIVPLQAQGQGLDSSYEAWPAVPASGIDISKLEKAQGVFNPLSLDRCRASSEQCVMTMEDFSSRRKNHSGKEIWALRPGVIAHYYPGRSPQYVFYFPERNIFYVAGYDLATNSYPVLGPFAGDPRLVLKKLAEAANAK